MSIVQTFLRSTTVSHVLAAVASGLYPILFYFNNNYTLVSSWEHLGYFILIFLIVPIGVFSLSQRVFAIHSIQKWQRYILPFLNVFTFLFFVSLCLHGSIKKKITLGIFIIAALFAFFLYKHIKKVIALQLLLAVIGLITLLSSLYRIFDYSEEWLQQPDDIAQVTFVSTPNVYYLQPDGYVNFSELNKGYYNIENNAFESFLTENNFTHYPDFRSNYEATLTSNSATFMMKHHYYEGNASSNEAVNARDLIVTKNTVLDVFKNNGYKTYLLTEMPYILLNRPKMGYDECNFDYSEIPFISTGLRTKKEILPSLKDYVTEDIESPKFFFIEIFNPKHINGDTSVENAVQVKRDMYINDLKKANTTLMDAIDVIIENDPNALIMIMADHGGYVGMEYLQQGGVKTQDRDLVYSIFSSALSIRWPDGVLPEKKTEFRSAVNIFRILFSYLSEDPSYTENLQDDGSYIITTEGAPRGVYKYIDDSGKVVFEKIKLFD